MHADGAVVLVQRGVCNFTDKAARIQQAGAAAMIMYDNVPGCISMAAAEGSSSAAKDIRLLPVSISQVR